MVGEWLLKDYDKYDEALEISEDDEIDESVKSAIIVTVDAPPALSCLLLPRCRSPLLLSRRPLYFSIVFVAASRLPRRQRYCHRAISNADVDAPPARPVSRLTLPVATRRDISYRTIDYYLLLLLNLRLAPLTLLPRCHRPLLLSS